MTCSLPSPVLHTFLWAIFFAGMMLAYLVSGRRKPAPQVATVVPAEAPAPARRMLAPKTREWFRQAIVQMEVIPVGQEGTAEDFRLRLTELGVEPPAHSNNWGSLCLKAIRLGLLVKTGEMRPMKEKKSHGRSTPVYRRTAAALEMEAFNNVINLQERRFAQ
jgi:hypothetical protein